MTVTLFRFDGSVENIVMENIVMEKQLDYFLKFLPSIQVNDSATNITVQNAKIKVSQNILYANSPSVTTGPINYLSMSNIDADVNGATAIPFLFNWGPDSSDALIPLDPFGQKIKNGVLFFNNIKVTLNNSSNPIFNFNPNSVNVNTEINNIFIRDVVAFGGKRFFEYTGKGSDLTIDNIFYDPKRTVFGTGSDNAYAFNLNAKDGNITRVNLDKATVSEGRTNFIKMFAESGNITRLKVVNFDFKTDITSAASDGHVTVESQGAFKIELVKFIAGNIQSEATSGNLFGVVGGTSNKKVLINDLCVSKRTATNIITPSSPIYTLGAEVLTI